MKKAILPGSFDPITLGHLDLIKRAAKIFDELIVLVANNQSKNYTFSMQDRYDLVLEVLREEKYFNVKVDSHDGFIVDYATNNNVDFIVRGLRVFHDFDIEFEMYLINKKLNKKIDTIFLPSVSENLTTRALFVKELIFKKDFDITSFVPKAVEKKLREKLLLTKNKDL